MDSSPIYGIILFLIFIFINIMMYGFGSAVKNINESEIQKKADEGSKKALKLLKIIDNPHRFINTIQLTATCIAVITGGYQSIFFIRRINKVLLSSFGNQINHMILFGISVVAIILIMLIILLCLGVMVPKKLGLKYSNGFAFTFINAISAIMTILLPFTAIIEGLANLILKLFRIDPNE
jgi:putative hemolysin